MEEADFKLSS